MTTLKLILKNKLCEIMDVDKPKTKFKQFKDKHNPIKVTTVKCVHCNGKAKTFIDIDYLLLSFLLFECSMILILINLWITR